MTLPTLTAALRTDSAFARALADALRANGPRLPDIAVAFWRRARCDHAFPDDPGWTCQTILGARAGYTCRSLDRANVLRWTCYAAVLPMYDAHGNYTPNSTWPRPAQDADEGIVLVTEALRAAGWAVHMPTGWTPGTRGPS